MGNIQQAQLYGSPTYTINGVPVTQAQFYAYGTGTPYTGTTSTAPPTTSTPSTPVPPDQVSTVTGIDPAEVAAATYGKIIPLWVGGQLRLGAHIIYGPTFRDEGGFRVCDFGVSFGMPANNIGTRTLVEIRLDGAKAWHVSGGYSYNPLVFRFYPGDETQAADALVIAAHPTAPVAHRGQCCIFLEGIRVADFNYKVPFVSALIGDTTDSATPEDGVNLGDALEQIAASPYVNLPSTDFITEGVSERVDAVIVAEKMAFMELINRYARLYLWDIVQTDKLKVIERGTVAPDLSLDFTNIMASEGTPPITVQRQQQPDVAKDLDYSWIDPDRDYEINTVTIKRPRSPVSVTASSGKDTISLPSVHTVQEATAWATLRKFKDELARETISFTASAYGYELEPGDIISVDAGFKIYILRVLETLRGANWTNQIKAEPVLRCAPPVDVDPFFANIIILIGPTGTDAGTAITDEGTNHLTVTVAGNAQIDTGAKKFTASLQLDGTGDWCSVPPSPLLPLGDTEALTIEAWVRVADHSVVHQIVACRPLAGTPISFVFQIDATTGALLFGGCSDGFTFNILLSGGSVLADGAFHHCAVDKTTGRVWRVYIDGVMVATQTTVSGVLLNTGETIGIGARSGAGSEPMSGWMEEIRITKGVARYASDAGFTPPTLRFPRE